MNAKRLMMPPREYRESAASERWGTWRREGDDFRLNIQWNRGLHQMHNTVLESPQSEDTRIRRSIEASSESWQSQGDSEAWDGQLTRRANLMTALIAIKQLCIWILLSTSLIGIETGLKLRGGRIPESKLSMYQLHTKTVSGPRDWETQAIHSQGCDTNGEQVLCVR